MIERILLPTDGSEAAENAIERAYELAEKFDAELHALYVIEVEALPTFANLDSEPIREAHRRRAEELLAEIAENAPDGVDVTTVIEEGHAEKYIVEYAEENDVDVITMGTHGREGLGRVLIGSVTERVVREAPCSVMVTPIEEA
ncbi:Nucleotide-binding protein, UspA family [Halalkaliarchaeum sp. AArc-CO]|uniref:universal stress protein n=1 Tax=unclassified Halalkaliarchaeum TaxID=2678344 RepID=UPI00217EA9C3|nr:MULTISPECIES: universal stress protein [unclassified Halalkaliarchaeum]MDR5672428.1 universal stress protein [Halalkaliarchaeum sp. AArc-GB]UWG49938.1 Nucleotide-binding protein, UspA family [Halalkaliarchaeum sp. AArc-CO]